jgi:hypothetical protein
METSSINSRKVIRSYCEERHIRSVEDGFVYQFAFPVKKAGAYQYRVAIRDAQGGKIGSASQFIEVPNLGKKHLATSSLVIENVTADQWKKMSDATGVHPPTNAMSDTALRRVRIGTVCDMARDLQRPILTL